MMSLEQQVTEIVSSSVIFTSTSWTISSLPLALMLNSVRCGLNSNGKTKLVLGRFPRTLYLPFGLVLRSSLIKVVPLKSVRCKKQSLNISSCTWAWTRTYTSSLLSCKLARVAVVWLERLIKILKTIFHPLDVWIIIYHWIQCPEEVLQSQWPWFLLEILYMEHADLLWSYLCMKVLMPTCRLLDFVAVIYFFSLPTLPTKYLEAGSVWYVSLFSQP